MSTEATPPPYSNHLDEARRIVRSGESAGVALRVTGGVGVAIQCPSAVVAPLAREYADVDLVGRTNQRREVIRVLVGLGYRAEERFNAMHGATRLLFFDDRNGRQLDVFLDRVEMCHVLDLRQRLLPGMQTLALADLLLMKLQIVQINHKDLLDATALLSDHPLGEDDDRINVAYLAELTAGDWGLWRTVTMIAQQIGEFVATLDSLATRQLVLERVDALVDRLEREPKTRGWRMRARIGERKRWYELPEEAAR